MPFSLKIFLLGFKKRNNLYLRLVTPGNAQGANITVLLTSCLTGLDWSILKIKTEIVSCHTADSKPVKQEVNGTVILPPLVYPGATRLKYKLLCFLTPSKNRFKEKGTNF